MANQLVNFARAKLSQFISDSATSITVIDDNTDIYSAPPAPTGGATVILRIVDRLNDPQRLEIISYTGRTGSNPYTLTGVTRGISGTAAKKWRAGCYVESVTDAATLNNINNAGAFGFVFNGGGDVITTGRHGNVVITAPYRCLVTSWTMTGDTTGSAVIDIIKGSYASYPFTTPSIAGSEKPSISGSTKNQHTLTTPWQLEAGDMLIPDVQSCVAFTAITLSFTTARN